MRIPQRALAILAASAAAGGVAAGAGATGAQAAGVTNGIWISSGELHRLPERGAAWKQLLQLSDEKLGKADLSDQDSNHDIRVLATAMVANRTDSKKLRKRAAAGIMDAIGTEKGGRTLALARNLMPYVIAADLIHLGRIDRGKDEKFRKWLKDVRREKLKPSDNPTLIATHELRPNNWGTHAGASRIAADLYLGDMKDLARAAAVFKGWLGDRSAYRSFAFGDKSWQSNPKAPVGVNPRGAKVDGMNADGALPDDMRRGCDPRPKPCETRYPWEAMQGAVAQAQMLSRQGYDAWNWSDQALRRAGAYLFDIARITGHEDFAAPAGHQWVPWLLNARYGTSFPAKTPAGVGKGMAFTDWTAPVQKGTKPSGRLHSITPVTSAVHVDGSGPFGTDRGTAVAVGGAAVAALALLAVVAARLRGRRRRTPGLPHGA